MMSSSRQMMMSTHTMAAPSNDVDFSFGAMQAQPYAGCFDAGGGMAMAMPSVVVERPPLLQHDHTSSHLYDSFDDLAAAGFHPFQEPGLLPPASLPLAPGMAMAMPSPLQLPLPGVLTPAEVYPFGGAGGAAAFLKREDGHHQQLVDAGGTIGLNLGRRTYFSPADVLAVDRLLTRSRLGVGGVLGLGLGAAHHLHHHQHQPPRCQAEGCKADLSAAKHYHRRHKVCEHHAKAAAVAAAGKQQRFCQQCSRFHVLAEFDDAKRSCRKRLTEHNRRRRKPAGAQGKDSSPPPPKRAADTCIIATSHSSDHHHHHHKGAGATAAAAISPNGSGVSCLDATDSGHITSSAAAAGPTALSLAALPPLRDEKDGGGGLDSMLMRQVHGRDGDDEHRRFLTSFVMMQQQQDHQRDDGSGGGHDGVGGGGNILSCPSVSSDHQNGGCNGFFEVDFI